MEGDAYADAVLDEESRRFGKVRMNELAVDEGRGGVVLWTGCSSIPSFYEGMHTLDLPYSK